MDILSELEERTAKGHRAMERVVPLMSGDAGWDDYEAYLRAFLGFLEPMEERLAHFPGLVATVPDFSLRRKSYLLRADLRALSHNTPLSFPVCGALPQIDGIAAAMGCLYVLEGSTLGGHVLLRHLRTKFGSQLDSSSAFLWNYGPNLGLMWKVFGERLRETVVTPAQREEAVRAADETFRLLGDWLGLCVYGGASFCEMSGLHERRT